MGVHGTIASASWIFMQSIVLRERTRMRGARFWVAVAGAEGLMAGVPLVSVASLGTR
jgi:hypothetical protein